MNDASPSADLAPAERLHPLFLITGLGGSLRGVAGGYAGIGYLAVTDRVELALIFAALLLVALVIGLILYWKRFEYRVGAHEIRIDSGILSRTHRSIPFDRVQDVDVEQGPIARLLGLAKVKFETGGASAGGKEEGVLPAIALLRAQALREHVRARRGSAAPSPVTAEEEARPLYAMDLRRVLTAGLFNFSLAIFAGLFGATQTFGDFLGFDPFERGFWERQLSGNPLVDYAAQHQIASVIGGLTLLLLAGLVTGLVRTLLRDFGFRLDRSGSGLRRRRGLLTKTDVTVPLRRAQAALLLTGPIRERFGWRELKLQSLAQDERGKGDTIVAPLATDEESRRILSELRWEPADADAGWERVSKAYVWSLALGLTLPFLVVAMLFGSLVVLSAQLDPVARDEVVERLGPTLVILPLLLGGMLLGLGARWLAWHRTAFAFAGEALHVRTGWWRRRTTILPLRNVQSVDLLENAVGRRFGIASLKLGVAVGTGFSDHSIPALSRERASQVRDALLSRFA